jgi:tetratricopeptide (TPR) repeat protein
MKADRDYLVKFTFPELRRLCETRGVTWGEVDFRWGVTDEQKAEGKVLPIVLAEVENCQPYFIGLLGERYGQVYRDEIPAELLERFPWLARHRDRSLTELEVLHGVLNSPEISDHALFYFRDPAYAANKPEADRSEFVSESSADLEKLSALKERIRQRFFDKRLKYPPRENYANPEALGQLILADFTKIIDELFPEGSQPDQLDRDALDHEAYAASRRTVYIGRQEYIDRLNAHAAGDGPPLVIAGESGGGKSALLANWTHNWSEQHPETPVVVHFIGAAPDSANWMAMLRRLLGEFQPKFSIQIEIPDQPDALRMAFANALHMVAARGRLVLVLDALNQIEDRDGAPDLVWLPPVIPANVRLIVSMLPGRPWEDIKKRGWPVLTVEPLTTPEREELIVKYLRRYSKTLSPGPAHHIAAAPQTGNGLYLSTLLNELRQFGSHEQLEQRIGWYLQAANPVELYHRVIERWEQDYGKPDLACENVVRESLVHLWAARRGLSETELLESLGTQGLPLPRAVWSPLYLAANDALVNRGGLLTFAHDFLRQAVRAAFIPNDADQKALHLCLADYFETQLSSSRRTDELPWQLAEGEAWDRLSHLLTDIRFFIDAWDRNQFEVKKYWTQIETSSSLRIVETYLVHGNQYLDRPENSDEKSYMLFLNRLEALLGDTGNLEEALSLRESLVRIFRESGDMMNLQICLGTQGLALKAKGMLKDAMTLYKEQESICRELGILEGLSISLGNQGQILYDWGDLEESMALLKEQERICRELGDIDQLKSSLGNQGIVLKMRGDLDEAMSLYREQERLARQVGDFDSLQISIGNQAGVNYARGDLDRAMLLYKEQEIICRELGNRHGLQLCCGNRGMILKMQGNLDGAMALYKMGEQICRQIGDLDGLQENLGHQGAVLKARGNLDGAMALQQEKEKICRQLGNLNGLQTSLGSQGLILKAHGDLDGAMALYKEEEKICRKLPNPSGLKSSLGNQGTISELRGDLDGAMVLYKEVEQICRYLGNLDGLRTCLGKQASVLEKSRDLEGAFALYKEEERICRLLGNMKGLSGCLRAQGIAMSNRGEMDKASTFFQEEEQIYRATGDELGLANSLFNQAVHLSRINRTDQLARAKCAESIQLYHALKMNAESMEAQRLEVYLQFGTRRSRRGMMIVSIGLLSVSLFASSIALGLWKPWLWIIGGPLAVLSACLITLAISPRLRSLLASWARQHGTK